MQNKTGPPDGMLLLLEASHLPGGSGVLCHHGHFNDESREAIQVAFDYVRSHMQQIRDALPSPAAPQRDLLAPDMDTIVNCCPVNLVKKGASCEWEDSHGGCTMRGGTDLVVLLSQRCCGYTVGAAAALCFISLAFGVRVRQDVAVTGVIDLRY